MKRDSKYGNALTPGERDRQIKMNAAVAISPEVGIVVKWSYIALRASHQHRFCLNKDLRHFMGTHRISLGAGLAF